MVEAVHRIRPTLILFTHPLVHPFTPMSTSLFTPVVKTPVHTRVHADVHTRVHIPVHTRVHAGVHTPCVHTSGCRARRCRTPCGGGSSTTSRTQHPTSNHPQPPLQGEKVQDAVRRWFKYYEQESGVYRGVLAEKVGFRV